MVRFREEVAVLRKRKGHLVEKYSDTIALEAAVLMSLRLRSARDTLQDQLLTALRNVHFRIRLDCVDLALVEKGRTLAYIAVRDIGFQLSSQADTTARLHLEVGDLEVVNEMAMPSQSTKQPDKDSGAGSWRHMLRSLDLSGGQDAEKIIEEVPAFLQVNVELMAGGPSFPPPLVSLLDIRLVRLLN